MYSCALHTIGPTCTDAKHTTCHYNYSDVTHVTLYTVFVLPRSTSSVNLAWSRKFSNTCNPRICYFMTYFLGPVSTNWSVITGLLFDSRQHDNYHTRGLVLGDLHWTVAVVSRRACDSRQSRCLHTVSCDLLFHS